MEFDEAGIDIVGVQEGRGQHAQLLSGVVFDRNIAPANEKGDRGCEIWLRRSRNWRVLNWCVHSDRLLEVEIKFRKRTKPLVAIAAHAPIEADTLHNKQDFWELLSACSLGARK